MAPYVYKPLQVALEEIRLVLLLPGEHDDDICFQIVHSPLPLPATSPPKPRYVLDAAIRSQVAHPWEVNETEDGEIIFFNYSDGRRLHVGMVPESSDPTSEYEPQFEALSYTWGRSEALEVGHVVPNEGNRKEFQTLALRPNLVAALRCLRDAEKTRVLWIDAICINQEDNEERNTQVKRMTDIYTLAHRVVAWLGDTFGDSEHAFATLQYVGRQIEATKSGRIIARTDAVETRLWRNDHSPSFDQRTWQALINLVEREWFYRVWCWQEIKLGERNAMLQCGSDTISWRSFWLAVLCLHNKATLPSMQFRERCRHIVFLKNDYTNNPMTNIFDVNRSKGCADPRDKIYGLLGIAPAYFRSNVVVDYSLPVEDVYKETFLAHLKATQRLQLLKHCDLGGRKIPGPSWVPDWSQTEFAAPILSEQFSSGASRAWFTYRAPNVLEVVGKQYTTIETVHETASKSEDETLLVVAKWYAHLPQTAHYVTGEPMELAFALTLCMERTNARHPGQKFLSPAEWIDMLHGFLQLIPDLEDNEMYSLRETANTIQKIRGRRFFVTECGHIGTAPAGAQAGDSICLILGTPAPTVLRRMADGNYQVVGECHVRGLSDAVGILGPLPPYWRTIIVADPSGRPVQRFEYQLTGLVTAEDPRLEALPPQWERVVEAPETFRNVGTGEVIDHDPRMSVDVLKARGVGLESFMLV
ncbi:hypothetical protein ACN47E_003572 [Coniothyrium glycines]